MQFTIFFPPIQRRAMIPGFRESENRANNEVCKSWWICLGDTSLFFAGFCPFS